MSNVLVTSTGSVATDITIKSHEYLVVYLSGLDKYDTELHTNFKLDTKDNVLILSDNKIS